MINDALRIGTASHPRDADPYVLPSRRLGTRPGVDLDHALSLADALEDSELARKLALPK